MDLSMFVSNVDGEKSINKRPETASLDDVVSVSIKHASNQDRHGVIKKFVEMYLLGIQWDWFESYHEWERLRDEAAEYALSLPETAQDGDPDAMTASKYMDDFDKTHPEPVRPELIGYDMASSIIKIDGDSLNDYLFKKVRQRRVDDSTVSFDGLTFDADERSQRRMLSTIMAAELTGVTEILWRMHDNSDVTVTIEQLRRAHAEAILNQSSIWIRG